MRGMSSFAAALVLLSADPALAHPPHEAAATVTTTPEGRRADLARFRSEFLAKDRSYAPGARAEAERRLATLEAEAARVSPAYFEPELAGIVALADNAHTVAFPGPRSRRYNRVEIRLVPFGEEFHVLRAEGADADLLGARLLAVDDRPVAELPAGARALAGGTPGWRDRNAGYFPESPEQMHALGVIGRPDSPTCRFALPDGKEIARRLVAEPANPDRPRANTNRWLDPAAHAAEEGAWTPLLAPGSAPCARSARGTWCSTCA